MDWGLLLIIGLILLPLLAVIGIFTATSHSQHASAVAYPTTNWLGRVPNRLGWICLGAAKFCKEKGVGMLPAPFLQQLTSEQAAHHDALLYVLASLVCLLLGLAVFGGDFPLTRLRGAAMFGIALTSQGDTPLDIVTGILWLAVPALLWSLVWDLYEQMPPAWQLFPRLTLHQNRGVKFIQIAFRVLFAVLALVMLLLAIAVSAAFLLWGQTKLHHVDATVLEFLVSAGFGLVVYFTAGIALVAIVRGLLGLVICMLFLGYCVFSVLAALLGVVGDTTQTLGKHDQEAIPAPLAQPHLLIQQTAQQDVTGTLVSTPSEPDSVTAGQGAAITGKLPVVNPDGEFDPSAFNGLFADAASEVHLDE
jgi:hypothetical protein